jgi:hypothetical protein
MRAGVRRGVQRAVNHAVPRLVGEALALGAAASVGRVDGKVALVAGAGGGIGGTGAEAMAREGAAVVCANIDGAAAETIATRIRAAGGRPKGIARAERGRPFGSPRGEAQRPCSRGPGSWAVAVNRLWRKFNYNLLGRFEIVNIRFRRISGDTIRCHEVGVDKRLIDETEWGGFHASIQNVDADGSPDAAGGRHLRKADYFHGQPDASARDSSHRVDGDGVCNNNAGSGGQYAAGPGDVQRFDLEHRDGAHPLLPRFSLCER